VRGHVGVSAIHATARASHGISVLCVIAIDGPSLAPLHAMETLIDPFELHQPGSEPVPVPRMRPRMASIVIDVEWDEPPPSTSLHGVRVWTTED